MDRRTFVGGTLAAGSLVAMGGCRTGPPAGAGMSTMSAGPGGDVVFTDAELEKLADLALDAAAAAGASYADIRIAHYTRQTLNSREQRLRSINHSSDRGFGVRVIAAGAWGFAASPDVSANEVVATARRAVEIAKANAKLYADPVQQAPVAAYRDIWKTPVRVDPFRVPLSDKVERLLTINERALSHPAVSFCSSFMDFVREHKFFASSEGSRIEQTLHRCNSGFTVTSIDNKKNSFQTRDAYTSPQGVGYEYIEDYDWFADVDQAGEDALAKHSARSVEPGKRDLILHPTNLWLTIHESVGHPTELDRALGMEANFAGTSFLTVDKLGAFQFASEIVNLVAEKTAPGSLATCGYDDDGVKTTEWPLISNGLFVDYQTTRDQAHWIGHQRSHGTCYAQSWKDVPFQRMPNINLTPGVDGLSLADIIASTDDGILVKGRGSYSIDQQRYNFQFGGQTFYEVKSGKIAGMLRDVAYQSRTPDFWRSCDALGGKDTYEVGGSFYDGKGEPGQINAMSHGCPPARFRAVNILNTSTNEKGTA